MRYPLRNLRSKFRSVPRGMRLFFSASILTVTKGRPHLSNHSYEVIMEANIENRIKTNSEFLTAPGTNRVCDPVMTATNHRSRAL